MQRGRRGLQTKTAWDRARVLRERALSKLQAADRQAAGEKLTRSLAAMAAVVEQVGSRRGITGRLICPCCEVGVIRFTVSEENGHVHFHCSTNGCSELMT